MGRGRGSPHATGQKHAHEISCGAVPLGSSWSTLARVSRPAPRSRRGPPANGLVPPDRWCPWIHLRAGPLTGRESSCDASPRIPRVLVAGLLSGNLAQKRHWEKHSSWGSMVLQAARRARDRQRVALVDASACSPLRAQALLPTSGLWGLGRQPVFRLEERLPWVREDCPGGRFNELERSGRTSHCVQETLRPCPEDERGAQATARAPALSLPGRGESQIPRGTASARTSAPGVAPVGRGGAAARGAGEARRPVWRGQEASSAEHGAITRGGQGRWGRWRRLRIQVSLPPAGRPSGLGTSGGQVCWGGTQEGGRPASPVRRGAGPGRLVAGGVE